MKPRPKYNYEYDWDKSRLAIRKSNAGATATAYDTTNRHFAQTDTGFKAACEEAGIHATGRQASKWRNKKGKAYAHRNN